MMTIEAARAFAGPKWLVTGRAESALAELCDEVVVCTPAIEESYCHTASYTCAVAALSALRGEDVSWLPDAVAAELAADAAAGLGARAWLVAGAGRDWPTAQEAALKLREGAHVAAEAHLTEELLHGHLAAIDEHVRCFVLEGEGRAAERAREAVAALEILGCDVTLVPTRHPVVDIVRFQLLTLDARGSARRRPGSDPSRRPALAAGPRGPSLARAVVEPVHEPERLPALVDRAALVVDEPPGEPDRLHRLERQVGLELGRLLRPSDPEPVRGSERLLQRPRSATRAPLGSS